MIMTRDEMIEQLAAGTCRVVFTKVNGETRDMTCTLSEGSIPEAMQEKSDKPKRPANPETLAVYDTNAEGWRSFRIANVTTFDRV